MGRIMEDWRTVVDQRGRFTFAVGLLLATLVSVLEILGAAIVVAALQLVTAAADAPVSVPILGDLDQLLPGEDRVADLRMLALLGAGFFLLRGAVVLGQLYLLYRATFSLAARLADRVATVLHAKPYEWHLSQNSSELASTAVIVSQQFAVTVFTPVQAGGAQVLLIIGLGAFAVAIEPVGTLGATILLGLVLASSVTSTRSRLLQLGQVEVDETNRAQRLAAESFGAIREVKILGISHAMRNDLRRSRMTWARALRQRATIVALPRILIETIAFAALIGLLALRGETGADALSGIGVMGYAVVRLLPTVNNLITNINMARGGQATLHTLAGLYDETWRLTPKPWEECRRRTFRWS